MVGNHANGDVCFFIFAISLLCCLFNLCNQRSKYIRVVVGLYFLEDHTQALKTHPGIYVLCRELFQRSVCFSIELHKDQIPDFYHLRVVLIDQFTAWNFCFFFLGSNVHVDFRAGTARSLCSHFPKIVFFVSQDDFVFWDNGTPKVESFLVQVQVVGILTSFKNTYIKGVFVHF